MGDFLVQILINTVAVALTIWLLPGIDLKPNSQFAYLLLGALLPHCEE